MIAFNAGMPGQEAVTLHFKTPVVQLHYKGRSQVNEKGVADIGEQGI